MEMNLQTMYFMVGVVGLALAAVFALAAVAYFLKADIRAVRADLSGKARQTGLSERSERRKSQSAKNVLTKEDEWQGRISQGDLAAKGDDAETESDGSDDLTDPGSNATTSDSGEGATPPADADPQSANADSEAPKLHVPAVPFEIVKSVVSAHSDHVIDAQGNEVNAR